jgi:hypothetical protein
MKFIRSTIANVSAKQIDDPRTIYKGVFNTGPKLVNQFLSKRILMTPLAMV